MQGIPVQKAILVTKIRLGGSLNDAFSIHEKTGWRKAEYAAWVPSLNALLLCVKHHMVPDGTVLTVPAANVASMEILEDDLDRFGEPSAAAKKKSG